MLSINIAKWYNNASSPVVLMIDDLNNLWFDLYEDNRCNIGEDWGYWRDLQNSSFAFLRDNLLRKFPEIKVTFFTAIEDPLICEYKYGKVYKGSIDENNAKINFFRSIHFSPNFEIAYHGLTHGIIKNRKYLFEWCSFNSVKEALRNIEKGQKISEEVFGKKLKGGKYPGYASNSYSDKSIDRTGFLWWCRRWTHDDFVIAGNDYSVLEMGTFGKNKVVDFPSTVNPSILSQNSLKRMIVPILRSYKSLKEYIEVLLKSKKIISIQEHAGAVRADGMRQTPNIIDDMPVLQRIFSFLRGKNVWFATCSEIANYYIAFTFTKIEKINENGLRLKYTGRVEKPWLTLLIDGENQVEITSPSGRTYKSVEHSYSNKWRLVNIEVENGWYQIK